jgi:Icc-related predicted phosphoesterase
MRLLLFSDLHGDVRAAQALAGESSAADILVGAGDFCNAPLNLGACLDVLSGTGKPCILVAGNNETTDKLREVCRGWKQAHVLHGSGVTVCGIPFFGLGGGIPVTPFGSWSYDFTEAQATELLKDCPPDCVLVSHSPPHGVVDVSSSGRSLGSKSVREAVARVRPLLVVCGHIHASAGTHEVLGTTPVVNAGPAGVIWEIG